MTKVQSPISKNEMEVKSLKKEIKAILTISLLTLKEKMGEAEFKKRVKKVAKILTKGIKKEAEIKEVPKKKLVEKKVETKNIVAKKVVVKKALTKKSPIKKTINSKPIPKKGK